MTLGNRQEPSGLPITNGQHRRPGLKPVLPKIRGSMDSQRGESSTAPSPSKSSSPFATAQEGEDSFSVAMGTDMQVGKPAAKTPPSTLSRSPHHSRNPAFNRALHCLTVLA